MQSSDQHHIDSLLENERWRCRRQIGRDSRTCRRFRGQVDVNAALQCPNVFKLRDFYEAEDVIQSTRPQAFRRLEILRDLSPRRIESKVDQLMALVDELESQLVASRTTGEMRLTVVVAE